MDGDLRFYLSGAAQAMILDKISPGWKKSIMGKSHIGLEDLLASVLKRKKTRLSFNPGDRITSGGY